MSGFYFAHRLTDEIGLSFAVVYIPEEKRSANIVNVGMLDVGDWLQQERSDNMSVLAGIAAGMIALAILSLVALFIHLGIAIADWIMGE